MVLSIFLELSLILLIALLISAIIRFLKQPMIIGYIITGIIVGPLFFNLITITDSVSVFAQMGIVLLLFIVGLHLNPKIIKEIGSVAFFTGIGQIVFTSIVGFFIAKALGFSFVSSLYISVALTLSSTIIITKLLSDKGDLETLYGKISIGFLIVQDIFAAFLLIFISTINTQANIFTLAVSSLIKGSISLVVLFLISIYILPYLTKHIAKSQEFLFIFSIGWCFIISYLFQYIGFSIEIGALLAGISLSMTPYSLEMSSKVKPIRDFFIVIFFITIGLQIQILNWNSLMLPILVFSLFVLIGNPLILMIIMGILGYTKRNSFLTGITSAQISEFSLILIALGTQLGHLSKEILPLVTLVGLFTIAGSTYMIMYSEKIYSKLSRFLIIFERKSKLKDKIYSINDLKFDVVLFGYNRIGYTLLKSLNKIKRDFLVVDFNPETISKLKEYKINCIYGDADDYELLDEIPYNITRMVISTIPNFETNMLLIEKIRKRNHRTIIIVIAHQIQEALELYKKGASYVLMPHFLGGDYAASMIKKYKFSSRFYEQKKQEHLKQLKERIKEGQEHPRHEMK